MNNDFDIFNHKLFIYLQMYLVLFVSGFFHGEVVRVVIPALKPEAPWDTLQSHFKSTDRETARGEEERRQHGLRAFCIILCVHL